MDTWLTTVRFPYFFTKSSVRSVILLSSSIINLSKSLSYSWQNRGKCSKNKLKSRTFAGKIKYYEQSS